MDYINEYMAVGDTLPEAYHEAIVCLHQHGEIHPCDDWATKQKEISMTMVVLEPLKEPMISKLFIGGPRELEQYRQEMLDGILDFEILRGNWAYTYHDRMVNYPTYNWNEHYGWDEALDDCGYELEPFNQIDFVIQELERNPSSRRAVIIVRDPSVDAFTDEPACLQHVQYFIRNGRLDCKVLFRSNDACKATFMNAFALICLQKRIADRLGVEVGTYTHRANSFHAYEQDFEMLTGYWARIDGAYADGDIYEVAADYKGDWAEMMSEYKPVIAEVVECLRDSVSYMAGTGR